MPFNEAVFWIGLTVLGTGLYFLVERASKRVGWLAYVVALIGACAIVYAIYAHYSPTLPKVPVWLGLLALTWLLIGLDYYDRRGSVVPKHLQGPPNAEHAASTSQKTPLQVAREQEFDREYAKLNRAAKEVVDQVTLRSISMDQIFAHLDKEGFAEPNKAIQTALSSPLIQRDFVGHLAIAPEMKEIAERRVRSGAREKEPEANLGAAPPLAERTFALCKELRRFLRELGPEPQVRTPEWRDKFESGYRLKFENRLLQIRNELQAHGQRDSEVDQYVFMGEFVPSVQMLKAVIEDLRVLAEQLED